MRRLPRWILFTSVVVLLALGGLTSVAVGTVRQSFPQLEGRVVVPGLSAPVEVLRDAYGVPQIYADQAEDLFQAQGYVHAADRFYEMDFRRHLAAGRLSELYGISQLDTDAYIRTLGWRRVAEQELGLLAPSTRRYLDAYAAGVNEYLQGRSISELSLEYSLLGLQGLDYTPEEWTAADSVSWLKVMAWQLGSNLEEETDRALLNAVVGSKQTDTLFPDYPHRDFAPIVTRGTVANGTFDPTRERAPALPLPASSGPADQRAAQAAITAAAKVKAAIPDVLGSGRLGAETGSNSWAVSGSRTASGHALLANDPHLATSIPSIFAQVGLHCRTVSSTCPFEVVGFSMAGMPGVVIGKNAHIAWGLTTSYLDVQDLYLEEVDQDRVREQDAFVPLVVREEKITIRGEDEPRTIRIRSSRHGPLLSDVDDQLRKLGGRADEPTKNPYAVALSWVASTPGRSMDALLALDQARDFTEFRAAAALLAAPSQNLIYADVDGNIGYQLPGAVPVRGKGNGQIPAPGWDERYDWLGMVDFSKLPYVYNPPSGFIVAANQPVIGPQYPYVLGSAYSYGWRSQEITDRLLESPPLTTELAAEIFTDDTIRVAADLVPALLRIKVSDPWVGEGQRTLVGWDYSTASDSAAAAYFNVVLHDILKSTFRDELPQTLWPSGGDRWYAVLDKLVDQPTNIWWDDQNTPDRRETRDDILLKAMTDARSEITSLMARDVDQWQWGTLHTVTLQNETLGKSGIAPIESLFNRGAFPVGGGPAIVNAMAYDDTLGYTVTNGPTMRMLVDLGDLDDSSWVNQSGVSGHAYHRNYDDQLPLWVAGNMWPFVSSRAAVERATINRLELVGEG